MSSKLASLHAGLIARKGEATPAIAHAAYSYVDGPSPTPQPMRWNGNDHPERRNFGAPPLADFARRVDTHEVPAPAEVPGPPPAPAPEPLAAPAPEPLAATAPEPVAPGAPEPVAPNAPVPVRVSAPTPPAPKPARAPVRKAAEDHPRPYRITLRLSADQRRRLRIAAAKEETSQQAVLSDALDSHLDTLCACELRDCSCLAREETH